MLRLTWRELETGSENSPRQFSTLPEEGFAGMTRRIYSPNVFAVVNQIVLIVA